MKWCRRLVWGGKGTARMLAGMQEQKQRMTCFWILNILHTPLGPRRFTLPDLNGSTPSHSFVTPVHGVETDSVKLTGQCPSGLSIRFSCVQSCERVNSRGSGLCGNRSCRCIAVRFPALHHADQDTSQLANQFKKRSLLLHALRLVVCMPPLEIGVLPHQTQHPPIQVFAEGTVAAFGELDLPFELAGGALGQV
ncbi:hypothetical protein D3C73_1190260 [compost metagenome]